MSGILGIWNLDGQPVDRDLLVRLNGKMAHRGPDGPGYWCEGPIGLAHQMLRIDPESLNEQQPLQSASGNRIVLDGRIDNREEVLPLLQGVTPDCPDSALVLALYDRFGEAAPEKLIGECSFAIWDGKRLFLVRDAIGLRPLYYCRAGNAFVFASEIKPILAHPHVRTRPNEETLADWVLRFPGEDNRGTTFFEGIYSVPPSHCATISASAISLRQYWDFDKAKRIRLASFEEYSEGLRHYFTQAVRRKLRSAGPITVSLSGGVDSSALYCMAETLHRGSPETIPAIRPTHLVWPRGSAADEETFLEAIESQYQIQVQRIACPLPGPFRGAAEEVRIREAASLDPLWAVMREYASGIKETGARLVLSGNFADELFSRCDYPVDYLKEGRWHDLWNFGRGRRSALRKEWRKMAGLMVPRALMPAARKVRLRFRRAAWDCGLFTDAFRRTILERDRVWRAPPGPFASFHAEGVYRKIRSRYVTLNLETHNKVIAEWGLDWLFPFLDRDLVGFGMAVPGDMVSLRESPKKLLRVSMSHVLPPAVANRIGKATLGEIVRQIAHQDLERSQLRYCLERDKLASRSYVDTVEFNARFCRTDSRPGTGMVAAKQQCDLLGLELWMQIFFEGAANGKQ